MESCPRVPALAPVLVDAVVGLYLWHTTTVTAAPHEGVATFLSEVGGTVGTMTDSELTDRERGILAFERGWWKHPGAKDAAIRERFDVTPIRYYQQLNGLIDRPASLRAEPVVVNRLRRLRSARRRQHRTSQHGTEVLR